MTAPLSWVLVQFAIVTSCLAWLTWSLFAALFPTGTRLLAVLLCVAVCAAGLADALIVRRRLRSFDMGREIEYLPPDMDQWTRTVVFFLLPLVLAMFSWTSGLALPVVAALVICWSLSVAVYFADMLFVWPPAAIHTLAARLRREARR